MKILVAHNHYRTAHPSGEDRVVAQETALLRAAGHEVASFARHSDDIEGMSPLGKARVVAEIPWARSAGRDFAARLRTERPDVVHLHNTFPLISASVLTAAARAGVPVVATLHHYRQVCPGGTLYRADRVCDDCVGRLPWPAIRHGCYRGSSVATAPLALDAVLNRGRWWKGVTRFFCISAAQRSTLIRAGMPAERLMVKHNFVPDPGVRREGPGRYALYLGRLTEEKGLRTLMQAWERLAHPLLPLRIAGAGPLEEEIAAWAANRPDTEFLGLVDAEIARSLVAEAAFAVVPSAWAETFGLVVVEAMAAGVPVIATSHGAFLELVEHGRTGLLCPPNDPAALADAMSRLFDVSLSDEFGVAARAAYEAGFTERVGLANLLAGYRAAIDATPGTSV